MNPLDCLCRYPLFSLLPLARMESWITSGKEVDFATGETILQEGTAASWACLVLSGRVRVLRVTASRREVSLGDYQSGEVFGEYGLLSPNRNTATCRASSPTRILRLPLGELANAIGANLQLRANLKSWLRLHGLLGYLRERAFLGFMSAGSALTNLDLLKPAQFAAGISLQADGLDSDRWYFIDSGQVTLESGAEPSRTLGPGDCFGARALMGIPDLPHAVATTDVACQYLHRDAFMPGVSKSHHSTFQSILPALGLNWRHKVWIGQREEADCGLACLAMTARVLGRILSLDDLRQRVQLGPAGLNLLELKRLAEAVGLRGQAIRVEPERLGEVNLPAIAHLRDGHYVVAFDRSAEGVIIGDPASGVTTIHENSFSHSWSGNLLLILPGS